MKGNVLMKKNIQLPLQTSSLIVGFMIWVLISSLMPYIRTDISLTDSQASFATAVPVILGSLLRIPMGYYANKFGAKLIFTISFILLLFPVFYVSIASSFIDLLIGGFFLGIGGAVFSIGVTSLPKYYPKEKHGLINGVYGVGNIGTAVTTFAAPLLAESISWQSTVRVHLLLLIIFALLMLIFGDKNEKKVNVSLLRQIKEVYNNAVVWCLCLFYFITFGSFVAFTVYLPNFLTNYYDLTSVDAGIRTAGFIALTTLIRPVGGFLSDRWNPYVILLYVFSGLTMAGIILSFSPSLTIYTVGVLSVAICSGIGNGTVFKLVPFHFSRQAGIVNGLVAAMGGLGGFFPPIVLSTVFSITGHYAIGFMALSQLSLASLIIVSWLFFNEKLMFERKIIQNTAQGLMITDTEGAIIKINPAFTEVTGYKEEEALGKSPKILQSGYHESSFYQKMWNELKKTGFWQGEIWNKRKNGSVYKEWLTITRVESEHGEPLYYIGQFNDLSNQTTHVSNS